MKVSIERYKEMGKAAAAAYNAGQEKRCQWFLDCFEQYLKQEQGEHQQDAQHAFSRSWGQHIKPKVGA